MICTTHSIKLTMNNLKEIHLHHHPFLNGEKKDVHLTYQLFGLPLHQAPIVLVNHALTGNSQITGENGWWSELIGPNKRIDLNRYTVIAFDIPGNGFDQNPEHLIADYKKWTTQIIAELFWKGLDQLNVRHLYAIIGGSLGGGISWEMAFQRAEAIDHLIPIASSWQSSDWLIGQVLVQDHLLNQSKNPIENARMHAMLLYRTPFSLDLKFNQEFNSDENQYAVESWLKYHGKTLANRFELPAYKLMNHLLKTIGYNRVITDFIQAIQKSKLNIHLVAIDSDNLFTHRAQQEIYESLKKHNVNIQFSEIHSIHGHDAFLMEYEQLNQILQQTF